MSVEHSPNDNHYGYFDVSAQTFNYTFDFTDKLSGYQQYFVGKR